MLTYWVTTYNQLFWLRVMTGVAIGGAMPLMYSVFGDMFPADQRSVVSSLIQVSTGVGQGVGQV